MDKLTQIYNFASVIPSLQLQPPSSISSHKNFIQLPTENTQMDISVNSAMQRKLLVVAADPRSPLYTWKLPTPSCPG